MAKIPVDKINNILLIRPDKIGDTMLITPAIALIRHKFPSARVTLLSQSYTGPLFRGRPDIDEVIDDRFMDGKIKSPADLFDYVRFIKSKQFDLSISFYNELPQTALAWLAGIPYRIGDRSKLLLGWMFNAGIHQKWSDITRHEVEHNLELFAPLEINTDAPPPLQIFTSEENKKWLDAFLKEKNIASTDLVIGIHPGTGAGNKAWIPERYAEVIDQLSKSLKAKFILLGGAKEASTGDKITSNCSAKPINTINTTSLPQLAALISRLNIFIGSDSGPMHIAAAHRIPTTALFPSKMAKPSQWGPWQTRQRVIKKPVSCPIKCLPKNCNDDLCLKAIEPQDVIGAVQALLRGEGEWSAQGTKAYWLARSLRILTNHPAIHSALTSQGFNSILVEDALSYKDYLDLIVREDVNVIHWVGRRRPLVLYLAKLFSALYVAIPPLFILQKKASVGDLTEFYIEEFKSRDYL
jgi:lipopolysaccharide heptosyltransferase II